MAVRAFLDGVTQAKVVMRRRRLHNGSTAQTKSALPRYHKHPRRTSVASGVLAISHKRTRSSPPPPRTCRACGNTLVGHRSLGRVCSSNSCSWRWSRRLGWNHPRRAIALPPSTPVLIVPSSVPLCPVHGVQMEHRVHHDARPYRACPIARCTHTAGAVPLA